MSSFNKYIHGARGWAALFVFLSHIGIAGLSDDFFDSISSSLQALKGLLLSGQYGVEVFFMISGYLISASVLRHNSARSFLLDRMIRIYPAFLPVVILIFVLGPVANYHYFSGVDLFQWIGLLVANVLFFPGVVPMEAALVVAWSLSYEAVFYLFSAFYKAFNKRPRICWPVILLIAVPFLFFYPRALFFLAGMLIFFVNRGKTSYASKFAKHSIWSLPVFLVSLHIIQFGNQYGIDVSGFHKVLLGSISLICGYLFFLEIVAQARGLDFLMVSKAVQFFGTISYSFYIWHTPVIFITKRVFSPIAEDIGSWWAFVTFSLVSFGVSVFVSYLSYLLFEKLAVNFLKEMLSQHADRKSKLLHS